MSESSNRETEIKILYPFVLRYVDGGDEVVITDYIRIKSPQGIITPKTSYYIPRFSRNLEVNTTVEVTAPNEEVHYFSVVSSPKTGAKKDGIYVSRIQKPLNLEELRTHGNIVTPDHLYQRP